MMNYAAAAFAIVSCLALMRPWSKRPKHPPGPKGLPIIGNMLDLQDREIWESARQWGETYGPLVHVETLGTSYYFINSYETAIELFDKRGAIYSSRPTSTMLKLEQWDWAVILMPFGEELRSARQLLHRFLQPSAMGEYSEVQTRSTHRMLARLLDKPERYPEMVRQCIGELIIMLTYGYQPEADNQFIKLAEKGVEAIAEAVGLFLVNAVPVLQYLPSWFPGAGFKKIAAEGYKLSMDMYHKPYESGKARLADSTAGPSILSKLVDAKMENDPAIPNEALIAKVTGVTYTAGADTMVSTFHTFLFAMLLHPEIQQRAQDEIDRVLGKDILPSFEDRPNLPYVEAIINETHRWQPVAPLGLAHTTQEDDEYNGYFIPSGSNVFANIWAMSRDARVYPKPDEFIPERWLPKEGKESPLHVYKVFFGFGRRICPGIHLADTTVFIGVVSILSAFNITQALDDRGMPITPEVEYTTAAVRHPKPFKYVLTPRSENMKGVIRQAVDATS